MKQPSCRPILRRLQYHLGRLVLQVGIFFCLVDDNLQTVETAERINTSCSVSSNVFGFQLRGFSPSKEGSRSMYFFNFPTKHYLQPVLLQCHRRNLSSCRIVAYGSKPYKLSSTAGSSNYQHLFCAGLKIFCLFIAIAASRPLEWIFPVHKIRDNHICGYTTTSRNAKIALLRLLELSWS